MIDIQQEKAFNPANHLIQLKSQQGPKDYLPVAWRIRWFRDECPEGTIETEIIHLDLDRECEAEEWQWNDQTRRSEKIIKRGKGLVIFKATVKDGKGGIATGTKTENGATFPDWLEKAETGAIGRALAGLGYGTQFTGDELDEGERLADAPVTRQGRPQAAESQPPDPTIKAVSKPLYTAALQAKQRALRLNVVSDDQGWLDMLAYLDIAEIKSGKDIAAINGKISDLQKEQIPKAS